MNIKFNGEEKVVSGNFLIDILIELKVIETKENIYGIAVSLNECIVAKKNYEKTQIRENDQLDVFFMMAGG